MNLNSLITHVFAIFTNEVHWKKNEASNCRYVILYDTLGKRYSNEQVRPYAPNASNK